MTYKDEQPPVDNPSSLVGMNSTLHSMIFIAFRQANRLCSLALF
jgi:hypothetical protein